MSPRCPLCLEPLGPAERLRRFCPAHPCDGEPFALTSAESIRCPVNGCASHALGDGHALLLCHAGCKTGQNPFYQQGADGGGAIEVTNTTSDGKIVTHWEIEALRAAAAAFPRVREMWFPSGMLIEAAPGGSRSGGSRSGGARSRVLVSLTGTIAVGKTFFAMHALDPEGYQDLDRSPSSDFIYCYPNVSSAPATSIAPPPLPRSVEPALELAEPAYEPSLLRHDVRRGAGPAPPMTGGGRLDAAAQEFLDTLHLRVLMKRNEAFIGKLRGTQMRPRNIKVAFFGSDPPPLAAPASPAPASSGAGLKGFLRRAKNEMSDAAKEIQTQLARGSAKGPERVLLLYDIAGEEATKGYSPVIADHDLKMDVLAVLLSAEDLPGGGGKPDKETVRTANARLQSIRMLRDQAKPRAAFRCCLVVTKFDLLRTPAMPLAAPSDRLKFLLGLLALEPADANTRALRGYVEGRRKIVDEVFFAWPEGGLDQDAPQIRGLEAFVDWCFQR